MKKGIACLTLGIMAILGSTFLAGCQSTKEDSGAYDKAMTALSNGDYETALAEFKNAADNDNREAESYRGEGIVYYERGDYDSAIMFFDLSLKKMKYKNSDFETDVKLYEADAYTKKSDYETAHSIYQELEEGDNAYIAYARDGALYLKEKNVDQASQCFEKSIGSKKNIEICLYIYESYKDVNLEADGSKYLDEATKITPSTEDEYMQLGKVFEYLEDYDSAVKSLNKAIEAGSAEAIDELGRLYLDNNNISDAKTLYDNNLNEGQSIASAYNGLAMCSIKEQDYDSALVYIEQGLSCGDETADRNLLFNQIIVYEYKLEFDTARQKTQEYLQLYPDDEKASEEYKFLVHGASDET